MNADERKYIRSIVRRVHPDLFSAHPFERSCNTESLKVLNSYVDELLHGVRPESQNVEFWVKEGDRMTLVEAELPGYGSLGPLFFAFGLITAEQLRSGAGSHIAGEDNTSFLAWLTTVVAEAVQAADAHEGLKRNIRELRASVEDRFGLATIQVGGEFAVSAAEQHRQIEALRVLDACLGTLCADDPLRFQGLNIRLYHPDSCPIDMYGYLDGDGSYAGSIAMRSHVADDGCLHIVADRATIHSSVLSLDLVHAHILTRLSLFWVRRARDLTPVLQELLCVRNVWCDSRTEQSSQRFVLWAGFVLEHAQVYRDRLVGHAFDFSMLVHSDTSSPMVDFLPTSSVLQVRSDCPPRRLVEFLLSESGQAAQVAAQQVAVSRAEEEALLERVRAALGAKHVIRVCSSYDQPKVIAAAHRLLESADTILQNVDLSGASIAIDDCYELWESGFLSIPYDFHVEDLQPQLQKLLLGNAPAAPMDSDSEPPSSSDEPQESSFVVIDNSEPADEYSNIYPASAARYADITAEQGAASVSSKGRVSVAAMRKASRTRGLESKLDRVRYATRSFRSWHMHSLQRIKVMQRFQQHSILLAGPRSAPVRSYI